MNPLFVFLRKKTKLNRKICTVISLTLSICVIAILAISLLFKIYTELIKLQNNLPNYVTSISYFLSSYYDKLNKFYNSLPVNIQEVFKSNTFAFLPKLEAVITAIAGSIMASITSLPKLGIFVTVTLLSSYFISSDKKNIRNFIYKQIPHKAQKVSIMPKMMFRPLYSVILKHS